MKTPSNSSSAAPGAVSVPRKRMPVIAWLALAPAIVLAADPANETDSSSKSEKPSPAAKVPLKPLNENGTVLLDLKGKRVILKTEVVLREGSLELFLCKKKTKEHESIVALDADAQVVHAALLAIKAKIGTPVTFNPEFRPPTGQNIDIFVNWTDEAGKEHRERAQNWIRNAINRFRVVKMESLPRGLNLPRNTELRYDRKLKELSWYGPMTAEQRDAFLALSEDKEFRKAIEMFYDQSQPRAMKADWVFAGSGFFVDDDGKNFYLAEDGDLISVSNFPSATIDVSIKSTDQADEGLLFEAWTDHIPAKGTPVTIELIPVFEESKEKGKESAK